MSQIVILCGGWGGLTCRDLPDSVIHIGSISHERLFPRMAAVVHHVGAGTTAAALRAGVPSIIILVIGDQPFWGRRVHNLGTGPEPIPRKKLTAAALASAINSVLDNRAMLNRARDLGETLRIEDGISNAVKIIQYRLHHINGDAGQCKMVKLGI